MESEANLSPAATLHPRIDQILRVADRTAIFIYVGSLPLPEICPPGLQATHQNWIAEVVRSSAWRCQWGAFQHFPIIWPPSWMGLFGAKSPKLTLVIGTPLGTQGISYIIIFRF